MSPLVALLATAREPRTAAELWHEVSVMRSTGCAADDLPLSKSEMERLLRLQKFAGRVAEAVGEDGIVRWSVVKQVEKVDTQKELFA